MTILWTLIFSALIAGFIGSLCNSFLIGLVLFFMIAAPAMKVALVIDVGSRWLKYHHDRNDSRERKKYESELFLMQQERQAQYLEVERERQAQYLEMERERFNRETN